MVIDLERIWTGDDVRALREKHDMSQQELGALLQIRQAAISDWERGKRTIDLMTSHLLSYIELDLAGELVIRKRRPKE